MNPTEIYTKLLDLNPPQDNKEKHQIRIATPQVKRIQNIAADYGFSPTVKASTTYSTERQNRVPVIIGELTTMPHPCYLIHGKYFYDSFFNDTDFNIVPQNYSLLLNNNKFITAPNLYVGIINKQVSFFNFSTNSLLNSKRSKPSSFTDFWKENAGIDFLVQICPYVNGRLNDEISLNIYTYTGEIDATLGKEYSLELENKWIQNVLSSTQKHIKSADQLISHISSDAVEQQDITEI